MRTFDSGVYLAGLMAELDRAAISLRLAESREQAGLTQDEMADVLRIHFRSVQNYESPKVDRVPWDKLDEWARITGRTKEWLLHGVTLNGDRPGESPRLQELLDQAQTRHDDLVGRLARIEEQLRIIAVATGAETRL